MKRAYKKVDLNKLSPKEKRAYKKHLAYTRKYTQDKRAWQKRIKAGTLDAAISLDQYRGGTRGHSVAVAGKAKVEEAKQAAMTTSTSDDVIGKLQNLMRELARLDSRKKAIVELLEKVGAA